MRGGMRRRLQDVGKGERRPRKTAALSHRFARLGNVATRRSVVVIVLKVAVGQHTSALMKSTRYGVDFSVGQNPRRLLRENAGFGSLSILHDRILSSHCM